MWTWTPSGKVKKPCFFRKWHFWVALNTLLKGIFPITSPSFLQNYLYAWPWLFDYCARCDTLLFFFITISWNLSISSVWVVVIKESLKKKGLRLKVNCFAQVKWCDDRWWSITWLQLAAWQGRWKYTRGRQKRNVHTRNLFTANRMLVSASWCYIRVGRALLLLTIPITVRYLMTSQIALTNAASHLELLLYFATAGKIFVR